MATTKDPEAWAELGQWIAIRRKQMGMDQRQLAEAAGVSENTISNYERGRVPARGKVPAGYMRVEKALKFGRGSVERILAGGQPTFEVEGPATGRLSLRRPEEIEDPLLRAVTEKIDEAMQLASYATLFADLASRWNASEELIAKYQDAQDELLANLFSPGHGPIEVQRYHEAQAKGLAPKSDAMERRPDLGWAALGMDPVDEEPASFGNSLRKAREAAGLERDELSAKTGVPDRIIELLEADGAFPGAFMHGPVYINLLANALETDPAPLVEQFQQEYGVTESDHDDEAAKQELRSELKGHGYSEKSIEEAMDNWDDHATRSRKARGE